MGNSILAAEVEIPIPIPQYLPVISSKVKKILLRTSIIIPTKLIAVATLQAGSILAS
jgi:hypothetical protein